MADAFKGLTIKLAADVRPLDSALRSVKSSAGEAQKTLSALGKALRFDPSDVKAMTSSVGLMDDKLRLSARSSKLFEQALSQAEGKMRAIVGSASSLESAQRGAYSGAQRIRDQYNGVDRQLQSAYDALGRFKAKSEGVSFEKAVRSVKDLARSLDKGGEAAARARSEIRKLAVGMANTGEDMPLGLGKGMKAANLTVGAITRLREQQRALNAELESAKAVQGYKAMRAEAVAAAAATRQQASELAKMKAALYASGGSSGLWQKQAEAVAHMDSALSGASAHAREMEAAYANAPRSLEAAVAKMRAMAQEQGVLSEKASALSEKLKKIESAPGFDKAAASAKNVYVEFERAQHELAKSESALKQAAAAVDLYRQKMDNLEAAGGKSYKNSSRYKKDREELTRLNAEVDRYREKVSAADRALESAAMDKEWLETRDAVTRARAEIERLNSSRSAHVWGDVGASVKNVGYALYSTVTPAITMAGRYAVEAAKDVDSAYRDMRKTVNGTEEQFEHLKDAALEFSRTHVTSAETMLGIEAMGGQLGIAVENLEGFAEVVSNLDIATDMDSETIAKNIGQLSNIMRDIDQADPQRYQRDITSFSDALVRLGNNSAAQESAIMNVMMRIASLGTISGFTTPQLLAISDAVAATGQGSEAAGTAISKTFSNIESAVGGGGKKLEAFANVAGMSADEFAAKWNGSPMEAFTAFIGGLKGIDDAGGSVDNTLAGLGISAVRQKQALEGLTTTLDVMTGAATMANDAWNGASTVLANGKVEQAGDAAREAARKSEGFSGQLEILKNNAKGMAVELADGVAPVLGQVNSIVTKLTAAFSEMSDAEKTVVVKAAVGLAALGPLTVGIGSTLAAGSNIARTFKQIPIAFKMLQRAAVDLNGPLLTVGKTSWYAADAMGPLPAGAKVAGERLEKAAIGARAFANAAKGVLRNIGIGSAVTLAAVGVEKLVEHYVKLKEHQDKIAASSSALSGMFKYVGSSAAGAAEDIAAAMKVSRDDIDALAEGASQMASEFRTSMGEAYASYDQIDDYAETISDLGNKGDLTADQMNSLKAAVEKFNAAMGTSYTVSETGAIMEQDKQVRNLADSIGRLVAQKKASIKADIFESSYKDALAKETEAYDKLAAKQKELASSQSLLKRYSEGGMGDAAVAEQRHMEELSEQADELRGIYDGLKESRKRLEEDMSVSSIAAVESKSIEGIIQRNEHWESTFGSVGTSALAFSDTLKALGYTYDELSGLSAKSVEAIEMGWDGSFSSMNALLAEHGVKIDETNAKLAKMAEDSGVKVGNLAKLYAGAKGDVDKLADSIATIQALKIEDKKFKVRDDGSIKVKSADVKALDYYVVGDKVFRVSDNGTIAPTKKKVKDLEAAAKDKHYAIVADDKGNTIGIIKKLTEESIKAATDAGYTITAKGANIDTVTRQVKDSLRAATSKEYTITARYKTSGSPAKAKTEGGNASGGISRTLLRHVPRNASGGISGIVTSATMTNKGLVGEAGAEAVMRVGRRQAIVPLSNRRYVRPFAAAVAAEIGQQPSTTVMNVYLDGSMVAGGVSETTTLGELVSGLRQKVRS